MQKNVSLVPAPGGMYRMADFAKEPDGSFVAPIYHVHYPDWRQYASPKDRCVVVLRDPRDSIVSWAFSTAYSHVTEEHIEIIRPAMLNVSLRGKLEIAMYTFWESSAAQRSWAKKKQTPTELVLTYESIIEDQHGAFRSILDFFSWKASDRALDAVINRLSFATRSGRQPGQKQDHSHYRSGVAGDWRNYYDRDLGRRFEAACPNLLVDLGYEKDSRWWESLPKDVRALDEGAVSSQNGESSQLQATVQALTRKNELLENIARERLDALEQAVQIAERALTA